MTCDRRWSRRSPFSDLRARCIVLSRRTSRAVIVAAARDLVNCPASRDSTARARCALGTAHVSSRVRLLLAFVVCVAGRASNSKTLNMGDSVPARLLPVALLLDHTPMLDRFADASARGHAGGQYVRFTPYGLASFYPDRDRRDGDAGRGARPALWLEWTRSPIPRAGSR